MSIHESEMMRRLSDEFGLPAPVTAHKDGSVKYNRSRRLRLAQMTNEYACQLLRTARQHSSEQPTKKQTRQYVRRHLRQRVESFGSVILIFTWLSWIWSIYRWVDYIWDTFNAESGQSGAP